MPKASNTQNGRVPVSLPRGTKYAKYVAVNGVNYLIPTKGVHYVPPEVAEELERSLEAEDLRDTNQAEMLYASRANPVV